MPKMDGIQLIRNLRAETKKTMVLMLTARDAVENRVEGLESGADDYLVKPFAPSELVARVHALLRRLDAVPENQCVAFSDVMLDPSSREASRGGQLLTLTVTEFNLLHLFLRHPRQVLERARILDEVWGYDFGGDDNVLEIYVGYLRKKLETDGRPRLDPHHPRGGVRAARGIMSIRFKFTLLYSAILALTLAAFGVILYSIQSQIHLGSH